MHYKLVTNSMAKLLQMLRNCQFTRIQMEDWQNTMVTHLLLVPYHHSIITRHSFPKIISPASKKFLARDLVVVWETQKGWNVRHYIKKLDWTSRLAIYARVRFFMISYAAYDMVGFIRSRVLVFAYMQLFLCPIRFLLLVEVIVPIHFMTSILLPNSKAGLQESRIGPTKVRNSDSELQISY